MRSEINVNYSTADLVKAVEWDRCEDLAQGICRMFPASWADKGKVLVEVTGRHKETRKLGRASWENRGKDCLPEMLVGAIATVEKFSASVEDLKINVQWISDEWFKAYNDHYRATYRIEIGEE